MHHEVNTFEWDPEPERGLKLALVLMQVTLLPEPADKADLTTLTVSGKNRDPGNFQYSERSVHMCRG